MITKMILLLMMLMLMLMLIAVGAAEWCHRLKKATPGFGAAVTTAPAAARPPAAAAAPARDLGVQAEHLQFGSACLQLHNSER